MATTAPLLSHALTTSGLPPPSSHFLTTILSSQRTQPPLQALLATAKHRLLSSDFSAAPAVLAPSVGCFPENVSAPGVRARRLGAQGGAGGGAIGGAAGGIPVQVLAVEDLSRSRWEQLEAIEARERGEMMKGREIIRVVEAEAQEGESGGRGPGRTLALAGGGGSGSGSAGPHRLVLQDVKGQTVYGLELKPVKGVGMEMSIGTKMLLSAGTTVARGVVLLEPEMVVLLGGKIESLHKAWVENRKRDLLAAVEGRT